MSSGRDLWLRGRSPLAGDLGRDPKLTCGVQRVWSVFVEKAVPGDEGQAEARCIQCDVVQEEVPGDEGQAEARCIQCDVVQDEVPGDDGQAEARCIQCDVVQGDAPVVEAAFLWNAAPEDVTWRGNRAAELVELSAGYRDERNL
jgi:hypothetical protein